MHGRESDMLLQQLNIVKKQKKNATYSDAGIVEGPALFAANSRSEAQGCPRRSPSRGILGGCVPEYGWRRSLRDTADRRRCGVLEARIVEGVRILDDLGICHQHQVFTCDNRFRYQLAVQKQISGYDQYSSGGNIHPGNALMTLNIFFDILEHFKN